MNPHISDIGGRKFLGIAGCLIPIDRIKRIDFRSCYIEIITDDDDDALTFTDENADALRKFLKSCTMMKHED